MRRGAAPRNATRKQNISAETSALTGTPPVTAEAWNSEGTVLTTAASRQKTTADLKDIVAIVPSVPRAGRCQDHSHATDPVLPTPSPTRLTPQMMKLPACTTISADPIISDVAMCVFAMSTPPPANAVTSP